MDAVIMAAGRGTRLAPLTANRPKPMVPLINRPMLDYVLESVNTLGAERIIVLVDYLADNIIEFLKNKNEHGREQVIKCIGNNEAYGTAGAVKKAIGNVNDTFIVLSGDVLSNANLKEMVAYHENRKSKMTIGLHEVNETSQYGIAAVTDDGRIERFLEKPNSAESFSNLANTGIYVCEPEIFDYVPKNTNYDFSKNLIPRLLRKSKSVYGYDFACYWNDVGKPETYLKATHDVVKNRSVMPAVAEDRVRRDRRGSILAAGNDCVIGNDLEIHDFAALGDNVAIGENVAIDSSVVWSNTKIDDNVEIHDAIIGENVIIKKNAAICNGAVIGDKCIIGEGSTIGTNIKIWCNSKIGSKSVITHDWNMSRQENYRRT